MNAAAIQIRPATVSDADAWLSLVDALADYEKLARPDAEARQRLLLDAFGDRGAEWDVFLAAVGAEEDELACLRLDTGQAQHRAQRHAGPAAAAR